MLNQKWVSYPNFSPSMTYVDFCSNIMGSRQDFFSNFCATILGAATLILKALLSFEHFWCKARTFVQNCTYKAKQGFCSDILFAKQDFCSKFWVRVTTKSYTESIVGRVLHSHCPNLVIELELVHCWRLGGPALLRSRAFWRFCRLIVGCANLNEILQGSTIGRLDHLVLRNDNLADASLYS